MKPRACRRSMQGPKALGHEGGSGPARSMDNGNWGLQSFYLLSYFAVKFGIIQAIQVLRDEFQSREEGLTVSPESGRNGGRIPRNSGFVHSTVNKWHQRVMPFYLSYSILIKQGSFGSNAHLLVKLARGNSIFPFFRTAINPLI